MAATAQDLKDFFALTGNNPPITSDQLGALADWFTDHTGIEAPTPNNFIDFIYSTFDSQVRSHKRATAVFTW